ncbi:MAG: type II CAAX endopeptidase family protein [Chitinophagaceae bacterium]|nr:type II CAAX endopeptidase family protein [Chitinophagaceae bacterium]
MHESSPGPGWRPLLAALSLLLSGLLWLSGLLGSLERPSVDHSLSLRQLQLEVLAAPAIPARLQPLLLQKDPAQALTEALGMQLKDQVGPPEPDQQLQLALLQQQRGDRIEAAALLERLSVLVPPDQRLLLDRLEDPAAVAATSGSELRTLLAPWRQTSSAFTDRLICEQLASEPAGCSNPVRQRLALWRLLAVNGLPSLLLMLGLGLLLRELLQLIRRRLPLPPLQGPALGLLDVTLLIAGGFVVLGELIAVLLGPLSTQLLSPLAASPMRQQSLQVVLLYLGLMLPPLAILRVQLAGCPPPVPPGGWLQWRWRPLGPCLRSAAGTLLMALPLVAGASWVVERLVGDPGGSNPLLELVLTANDPLALLGFAFTAMVLAPLFEETLFRGVLLPVLGQRWGPVAGLLGSALAFALAHVSLGELVPLAVLGLGLGWLRLKSASLAPCVLMHALWNTLTFANLVLLAG